MQKAIRMALMAIAVLTTQANAFQIEDVATTYRGEQNKTTIFITHTGTNELRGKVTMPGLDADQYSHTTTKVESGTAVHLLYYPKSEAPQAVSLDMHDNVENFKARYQIKQSELVRANSARIAANVKDHKPQLAFAGIGERKATSVNNPSRAKLKNAWASNQKPALKAEIIKAVPPAPRAASVIQVPQRKTRHQSSLSTVTLGSWYPEQRLQVDTILRNAIKRNPK